MLTTRHADGRELGDKDAAGVIAGCSGTTFHTNVRRRKPFGNPAPQAVERDFETGRLMWDLAEVRAWQARRPGMGRRVLTDVDSRVTEQARPEPKKPAKKQEPDAG